MERRALAGTVVKWALSLAAGAALVVLTFRATGSEPAQIREALAGLEWLFVALIVLCTLAHLWITGEKWRILAERQGTPPASPGFYLYYSAASAVLGQVLPVYAANVGVRAWAAKRHQAVPVSRGVFTALYDQFSDLLVALVVLLPALLTALRWCSMGAALALMVAGVALTGLVVGRLQRTLVGLLARLYRRCRPKYAGSDGNESVLYDAALATRLYWIAALRYAVLILRGYLVARAAGYSLGLGELVFAGAIVQFAPFVSFTPGALGVVEWGWIGTLAIFGVPAAEAARFALVHRILGAGAIGVVYLLAAIAPALSPSREPAPSEA